MNNPLAVGPVRALALTSLAVAVRGAATLRGATGVSAVLIAAGAAGILAVSTP